MPDNSFDIVSEVDMPEVVNAVQQAIKEIATRFDLKDSKSTIELKEKDKKIELTSSDDFKIKAVGEILSQKLVKRKVPTKNLTFGKIEASGSRVKQDVRGRFRAGSTVHQLPVELSGAADRVAYHRRSGR
jgi:uncharacterized protein YajQ (UPF0234 family)